MASQRPPVYKHDPDATLDYTFNWDAWLPAGDFITTATVTASDPALVVVRNDMSDVEPRYVVSWLRGGTEGTVVDVTCHIETSQGRKDDRTIILDVQNR